MSLGTHSRPLPIASDEDLADEPRERSLRDSTRPIPRILSFWVGAVLTAAGAVLNSPLLISQHTIGDATPRLAIIFIGQVFWMAALVIFIIRGNIYAYRKISPDGYARAIFNTVKWVLVTICLLFDAFWLERLYEQFFLWL